MSDDEKKANYKKSSEIKYDDILSEDEKDRAERILELKGLANIKTENFDSNEVARDLANSITDKIYHHYLPENNYFDRKKKNISSGADINLKNELRVDGITTKTIDKYQKKLAERLANDFVEQTIKEIDEQYQSEHVIERWIDGTVKRTRWLGALAIPAVYVVLACLLSLIAIDSYKLASISYNTFRMATSDDNPVNKFLNDYQAAACDMESQQMLAKFDLDSQESFEPQQATQQNKLQNQSNRNVPSYNENAPNLETNFAIPKTSDLDISNSSKLAEVEEKINELSGEREKILNTSRFELCMNAVLLVEDQEFNIIRDKMNRAVSLTLSVLDLLLILSLTVMVTVGMYENTVSRIGVNHGYPTWFGKLDIGELKIKVAASIVIISSIHLLMMFMQINLTNEDAAQINFDAVMWTTIVHLVFVLSAIILASMEYVAVKTKKLGVAESK